MTQGFNKDLKYLMTFNTPPKPHKGVVRNQEIDTNFSYNIQKIYRSVIGSLIYIVKYSRPKLYIVVREIFKCMDEANTRHYKAILREIKYVIDTISYCY